MTGHALYSPSRLTYLQRCPGYTSGLPSDAAQRGTDIDAILTRICSGELLDIPDEWSEQIQYGLAQYEKILSTFGEAAETFAQHRIGTPLHGVRGTADLVIVDAFEAVGAVLDWKTGMGERPPVSQNLQLLTYGWGLIHEHGLHYVDLYLVELDRRSTSHYRLEREACGALAAEISAVIRAAKADDPATYGPGSYCRYCVRAVTCPAVEASLSEPAEIALATRDSDPATIAHAMHPAAVAEFLDRYKSQIEFAGEILGAVEARARAIHEAGGEVPGWTWEHGRRVRKWRDEHEAAAALRGVLGDRAFSTELKTPAQVEKLRADGVDLKAMVKAYVTETSSKKLVKAAPVLVLEGEAQ